MRILSAGWILLTKLAGTNTIRRITMSVPTLIVTQSGRSKWMGTESVK